ncbi:MAG: cytochrome c3 family protein [Phycisphaerae bacterium]
MRASLASLAVLALATSAAAQTGITGSDHDFNGKFGLTQICLPCHTPHKADTTIDAAPLWNHEVSSQTFTMYTTLSGRTGDVDGPSKLCLSCHDGVTAIDSFGGQSGTQLMLGSEVIGTDLSDDHPIGITYVADTDFHTVAEVEGAGLPLFNVGSDVDRVECGSCHNPHDDSNGHFLRVDNTGSNLCLTCHIK